MIIATCINKIQWAKRLKADKHTGELCHSKEALLLDVCFQRTGSWFPKSWGKRIASYLENLGCGRQIVLGHSPEYYKNSRLCKYLNSCWAKCILRIYIYKRIYSDVFHIFIMLRNIRELRLCKKINKNWGNVLPFFCNIPIVRVQADTAHLKLSVKNASEIKSLRKLRSEQYWSLSLIFKAKRKVTKGSKSVEVFWPHWLLKKLEVAVLP